MNETLPADNQAQLLPQLQTEREVEDLSTVEGIQQFLRRLLSEISNGCRFGHTVAGQGQCMKKRFSCMHFMGDGPGSALAPLLSLNKMSLYEHIALMIEYRNLYSWYYGMDRILHETQKTTERRVAIETALERRESIRKFILKLLVICDRSGCNEDPVDVECEKS
jgi:hypothetical protein